MYQWIVFLHVAAVFMFLIEHGAEIAVTFKLRNQKDPATVGEVFSVMPDTLTPLRIYYLAIIVTGLIAGFMSVWWRLGWMWISLVLLIMIGILMNRIGKAYLVAVSRAAGYALKNKNDPSALEKFNAAKNTKQPEILALTGIGGLLVILWLMRFKPF